MIRSGIIKSYALETLRYFFFMVYAGLLAAWLWFLHEDAAFRNKKMETQQIKKDFEEVLPAFENQPWKEAFWIDGQKIFPAFLPPLPPSNPMTFKGEGEEGDANGGNNVLAGVAFERSVDRSGNSLRLLLGIHRDGRICGAKLLGKKSGLISSDENEKNFLTSLAGHSLDDLYLMDEGGPIEPMEGDSAFSSQMLYMIRQELDFFLRNKERILAVAMESFEPMT